MNNELGRKLEKHYECPIDNVLIDFADHISPLFKEKHMTPNDITTLSLIFGVLAVYFLYQKKYKLAGVCYFVSYFFDDMDGFYARKYQMVSEGGDAYDHYKDITVALFMYIVLFVQKRYLGIILYVIVSICSINMLGCQELYYNKQESKTLNGTKRLCLCKNKSDAVNMLPYLRYCGVGTMNLAFSIYLFFLSEHPY